MRARFDSAEVSLTATISEVFGQILRPVMPRDTSTGYEEGELIARNRRKFHGLSERQNALRMQ